MSKAREVYSPEFKQEAVKLVKTTGKSCAEIARDLGIPAIMSFVGDNSRRSRIRLVA